MLYAFMLFLYTYTYIYIRVIAYRVLSLYVYRMYYVAFAFMIDIVHVLIVIKLMHDFYVCVLYSVCLSNI